MFQNGCYCKVFRIYSRKEKSIFVNVSVSSKNKITGKYEDSFSTGVNFVGNALKVPFAEGDKLCLDKVGATARYDKTTKKSSFGFFVFECHLANDKTKTVSTGQEAPSLPENDAGLPF